MTAEVRLSRGLVALVDDADYERVITEGKWHAHPSGNTFYARRNYWVGKTCKTLLLHHFLTGWALVDHRNRDGLDNRRSNLRSATHTQNIQNSVWPAGASGYRGVYQRESGRWGARLTVAQRVLYFGTHETPEQAARAYDAAALTYFGEFARLNFPSEEAA